MKICLDTAGIVTIILKEEAFPRTTAVRIDIVSNGSSVFSCLEVSEITDHCDKLCKV